MSVLTPNGSVNSIIDELNQNTRSKSTLDKNSDTTTFGAVQNATTADLPTGDAKLAWKNVCDIFQPATKADLHDLEQQFNQRLKY
jgi:hypothetical protein